MVAEARNTEAMGAARTLRLSIIGDCNLQCFYCRSIGHANDLVSKRTLVQPSDVSKLVRILGEQGIRRVVIGGGEPLLRKDAPNFVKAAYGHKNISEVRLITNGTYLKAYADGLRKMGLKRVDIHFDSLNFQKYHTITRRDDLFRVLDGIEKLEKFNYPEIRINVLLLKGINDDELVDFARLTKDRRLHVRFLQYCPRDATEANKQRLAFAVLRAKQVIENYQRLERIHDLEADVPVPTFTFGQSVGKISFLSDVEIAQEYAVPQVLFTSHGLLVNELVPNRPAAILEDLRRDAKEARLHRTIEKVLNLHLAPTPLRKGTVKEKAKTKKTKDKKPLARPRPKVPAKTRRAAAAR